MELLQSCTKPLMLGLHRTPKRLEIDWGVGRQGHMFLLCYSQEGHKLLLNTRNNSGLLAIEIDKLQDHF